MRTPLEGNAIEPRPGGRFEALMVNDKTGNEHPAHGVFVEFDAPRKFSFTEAGVEGGTKTSITFNDFLDGL